MSNIIWTAMSQAEYNLAERVVADVYKPGKTLNDYLSFISKIERYLSEVNLETPFASDGDLLSNNIIAQIAYLINDKFSLNSGNGVVLTPSVLAEDMVRMSIIEWLKVNTNLSEQTIVDFVYKRNPVDLDAVDSMVNHLANLTWYDPCVGGGVFPIAIITIYKELEIRNEPIIYGNDINPLYVEATKKRVELSLKGITKEELNRRFTCMDSLERNLNVINLFNLNSTEKQYDIVIGNPPYVKAGMISKTAKLQYEKNYPEIHNKSADLYTYFICHGLNALNDTGVLTYVTPAQFQMSNYGKPIREVIEKKGELCAIADFNELPVFKNIGVHTSVYSITKRQVGREFIRYEYDLLPSKEPFRMLYELGWLLPQENVSSKGWFFSSNKAFEVLAYLERKGSPLKIYSKGVFSGVKSGCKGAFFIKENDMVEFAPYDRGKCKKMLLPKQIKRWKSPWVGNYFVVVKKNEVLNESSRIYKHMLNHKDELESRSDNAGHKTWYGLRECGYYELFDLPKIIYPDISTECRFSMDTRKRYIPDGAFFIPGEDYYLLGILNSCIGRYYFKQKCARIGNPTKGGRIRFKKAYIEDFPVVVPSENLEISKAIIELAEMATKKGSLTKKEEKMLDEYALTMYGVSDEIKKVILEGTDAF